MTSPRWLRRKKKIINKMEEMKKIAKMHKMAILEAGPVSTTVKFETEDGEFDSDKFVKYFLSLYSIITKSYSDLANDRTMDRKTRKYLLYEDPIVIMIDISDYILGEWKKEGKSMVIEANSFKVDK
jgi:hypothetical protein